MEALKLPLEPELIVSDAGVERADWSSVMVNVTPLEGTFFERFTVQVDFAFEPRVDGLHASEVTVSGVTSPILVLADDPL